MKKDWKNKVTIIIIILHDEIPIPTSPNLISVFLTFPSQAESRRKINVEGLLDTGCLAGDFVARKIVVDQYNIKPILQSTAKLSACSGLDNTCYDMSKSVIVSVNFFNEQVNKINTFTIKSYHFRLLTCRFNHRSLYYQKVRARPSDSESIRKHQYGAYNRG